MNKSTTTNSLGFFWTGFIGTLICWVFFNTVPWMESPTGFVVIPLFIAFAIIWFIGLFQALLVWGNGDSELRAKVKPPLVITGVALTILLVGAILEWTGAYDWIIDTFGLNIRGKFIF